jgi:hypothetical protein
MKFCRTLLALAALAAAAPSFANSPLTIDFEATPGYGVSVLNTYAALGASFSDGALAFTNDALGPYFSNAPTPGTADPFAGTVMVVNPGSVNAVLNIAGGSGPSPLTGFVGAVSMDYASMVNAFSVVQIFAGLNGSGQRLGQISLSENQIDANCSSSALCHWQNISLTFAGTAQSMVFSSNDGNIAFDNISITAVPEPQTYAMLLAGLAALGFMARRRRD